MRLPEQHGEQTLRSAVVGNISHLAERRGNREVFYVLAGETEAVHKALELRVEVLRVAVEECLLHIGERGAAAHELVERFASCNRASDSVQEGGVAADNVDLRVLECLADDARLAARD